MSQILKTIDLDLSFIMSDLSESDSVSNRKYSEHVT